MIRKQIPAKIDSDVLDGLRNVADASGMSLAKYIERLLVGHLKGVGALPIDFEPVKLRVGGYRPKKELPPHTP